MWGKLVFSSRIFIIINPFNPSCDQQAQLVSQKAKTFLSDEKVCEEFEKNQDSKRQIRKLPHYDLDTSSNISLITIIHTMFYFLLTYEKWL